METCCACQDCQVELPGLKSRYFISLCTLNTVMISPRNDKELLKLACELWRYECNLTSFSSLSTFEVLFVRYIVLYRKDNKIRT